MPQLAHPHWSCGLACRYLSELLNQTPSYVLWWLCKLCQIPMWNWGKLTFLSAPGPAMLTPHVYEARESFSADDKKNAPGSTSSAWMEKKWMWITCVPPPPLKFCGEPDEASQQARCPTVCATARKEPNLAVLSNNLPRSYGFFFFMTKLLSRNGAFKCWWF